LVLIRRGWQTPDGTFGRLTSLQPARRNKSNQTLSKFKSRSFESWTTTFERYKLSQNRGNYKDIDLLISRNVEPLFLLLRGENTTIFISIVQVLNSFTRRWIHFWCFMKESLTTDISSFIYQKIRCFLFPSQGLIQKITSMLQSVCDIDLLIGRNVEPLYLLLRGKKMTIFISIVQILNSITRWWIQYISSASWKNLW
jgi:hypothetical protein